MEVSRGEVGQRGVLEVGNDLLDDGVSAVGGLSVHHWLRVIGEYRVIAVDGEQLVLPIARGGRVESTNPAHDQPGGDVLGAAPSGERGKGHLGHLSVGNPALLIFVIDRVGVADRHPGLFIDAGNGPDHRWGQAGGQGKAGPSPPRRGDDVIAIKRRVCAHDHQPGGAGAPGAARASASSLAAPRTEFTAPRRSRVAAIIGADSGVEIVASSALSPFTPM